MNDKDLERKIKEEMDREIAERGYASPADLLVALGYLDKGGYREWREGKVPYLEKVLRLGPQKTLRLLSARIAELEAAGVSYAELIIENGLKRRGFRGLDDAEKFLEARR